MWEHFYKLTCEISGCSWKILPQKLSPGLQHALVMTIPSDYTCQNVGFFYVKSQYTISPEIMSPLEQLFEKAQYIKKEHYSNYGTFEISSLVNVPGHYLRKYGIQIQMINIIHPLKDENTFILTWLQKKFKLRKQVPKSLNASS